MEDFQLELGKGARDGGGRGGGRDRCVRAAGKQSEAEVAAAAAADER